jgi:coiled-coil domain-containing protein 130
LDKVKKALDDSIIEKYALPEDLKLVEEDEDMQKDAKEEWEKGRRELRLREGHKRRKLGLDTTVIPSSSTTRRLSTSSSTLSKSKAATPDPVASLRSRILGNTRQTDPFGSNRHKPLGVKDSAIMIKR